MEPRPQIAAVIFEPGAPVDALIAEALAPFAGRQLLGWLQGQESDAGCECRDIFLRPVQGGPARKITQDLGAGSSGCRLDTSALAEVAGWLSAGMTMGAGANAADAPELLVLNRFGKSEAEGGGFRAILEQALGLGVPVLLAVNKKQLSFWHAYAGDMAVALPFERAAISAWVAGALAQPCAMVKTIA